MGGSHGGGPCIPRVTGNRLCRDDGALLPPAGQLWYLLTGLYFFKKKFFFRFKKYFYLTVKYTLAVCAS